MELWIIAAVALTALLAVGAWLYSRRSREAPGDEPWVPPRNQQPWDAPPEREGSRPPTPPPAGLFTGTGSEELSGSLLLESQELYLIDDDEPTGPVPRILVRGVGSSVAGEGRAHNEDAFLVSPEHELYVVADGMGGYAAGEVASSTLIETLREVFDGRELGALDTDAMPRRAAELVAAIHEGHRRIRDLATRDSDKHGMATTVVAVRISPRRKRIYVAHVGDSRCYRIRDGAVQRLTADHTLGALGISGPTEDKLSRAVGAFDGVEVDLTVDEPREGDFYLLCSDGLHKAVPDDELLDLVTSAASAEDALDFLLASAQERGGRDDVTAVLVRVDAPDGADPDQSGAHRLPGL